MYSNCCCSCSFEPEIIKTSQSSHQMYSNNILNSQESTTILNASTKKSGNLLKAPHTHTHTHTHIYIYIYIYQELFYFLFLFLTKKIFFLYKISKQTLLHICIMYTAVRMLVTMRMQHSYVLLMVNKVSAGLIIKYIVRYFFTHTTF